VLVKEKADQGTVSPLVIPEIVTLPAEIDIVLGVDRPLHIYPSLAVALTSSPGRPSGTTR
jgi:hypothetical protein